VRCSFRSLASVRRLRRGAASDLRRMLGLGGADGRRRRSGDGQPRGGHHPAPDPTGTGDCEAILRAGGAGLDDVVEVGVLLTDPADFAGLNEEYALWFSTKPPTRYVAKLGVDLPGIRVSIRMTAFVG